MSEKYKRSHLIIYVVLLLLPQIAIGTYTLLNSMFTLNNPFAGGFIGVFEYIFNPLYAVIINIVFLAIKKLAYKFMLIFTIVLDLAVLFVFSVLPMLEETKSNHISEWFMFSIKLNLFCLAFSVIVFVLANLIINKIEDKKIRRG